MLYDITFYREQDGSTPVADFLLSLPLKEQDQCFQSITLLMELGAKLPSQYTKPIEEDLWELPLKCGWSEIQLLYYTLIEDLIVFLHGVKKRSQQTPSQELKIGIERMNTGKGLQDFNEFLAQQMQNPKRKAKFEDGLNALRFGVLVCMRREELGLTQVDMEQFDISQDAISRIEDGILPDSKTQTKLMNALKARMVKSNDKWLLEPVPDLSQAP